MMSDEDIKEYHNIGKETKMKNLDIEFMTSLAIDFHL